MKKTNILFAGLFLLTPALALAANLGFEETYTLPPTDTLQGNAYVMATNAILAGTVTNDLVMGAGDASLSGVIGKDVLVFGGTIESVADVGEDLRGLGGKIVVTKKIGGDLVMAGGSINVLPETTVGGDAILVGGSIKADGTFNKSVYLEGGDVEINGKILGDVRIFSAGKITVGDGAVITGNLVYTSEKDAVISGKALIVGRVSHQYSVPALTASTIKGFAGALVGIVFLVRVLLLLAAALVLVYVFRRISTFMTKKAAADFWHTLLVGFIVSVVTPLAAILLGLSVIGGLLAIVVLSVYAIFLILGFIYSGVIFGAVIFKILGIEEKPVLSWQPVVAGVLLLQVLSLIPVLGIVLSLVFGLAGIGGVAAVFYERFFVARK